MDGARRRLERLETARMATSSYETPPYVLLHLKHISNAQREMDGLEPIPLTFEEEELERESERDALENLIPMLRADPGWQSEGSQSILDSWEENARRRVESSRAPPPG